MSRVAPKLRRGALGATLTLSLVGCADLERFSTSAGESYCGSITLASEFREGLGPVAQMRLTLDTAALDAGGSPGRVTTSERLSADAEPRRLIDEAALRPIKPLAHDPLSFLQFGDGRERNAIYAVSVADSSQAAMLAVLSLKSSGEVEVRLLRPSADEGTSDGVYGVFTLKKKEGKCGF